jgi:hypothetical protein
MNPSAIGSLTRLCEERHHGGDKDMANLIANFLTAWSAWEAVRTRLVRVIIHKQGWLIKDADAALRIAKLSSMKNAAALLQRLGLPNPSHWKGQSGQTWRTLLSIEPLRHRLTHGFQTADPKLIKIATAIVLEGFLNQQWMERLEINSSTNPDGFTKVGPIMTGRSIIGKTSRRSRKELFDILGLEERVRRHPSLPSLNQLEGRLKAMGIGEQVGRHI